MEEIIAPLTADNFRAFSPARTHHGVFSSKISGDGFSVEGRRYCWDGPSAGLFQSSSCYLQFTMRQRQVEPEGILGFPTDSSCYQKTGKVLLIPAGVPFYVQFGSGEQDALCCEFDMGRFEAFGGINWSQDLLTAAINVQNGRVNDVLRRLFEEVKSPGFASNVIAESMIIALTVELYRHFEAIRPQETGAKRQLAPWQIRLIEEQVEGWVGDGLSVKHLASICNLSPRHLMRIFKHTRGVTLGDYIASVRLQRAKSMLRDSNALIKEVAYACGFRTTAAFSTAFTRAVGVNPRTFRSEYF